MRTIRMTAKKAGTCRACNGAIEPGDAIYWARGSGATHVDCNTAKLRHTLCTVCKGTGSSWNGAPCRQCDGTGQRKTEEFARAGGHPRRDQQFSPFVPRADGHPSDPMGVDLAYEDECARRCGL